jgi:transposase
MESSFKAVRRPESNRVPCNACTAVCGKCGKETIVIGYESPEQLDVEPARYFVRVNAPAKLARNRESSARRCRRGSSIKAWPAIESLLTRWSANMLTCTDLSPERDPRAGDRDRAVPGDNGRLGDASRRTANSSSSSHGTGTFGGGDYIQADETPVGVHTHDGRGKNRQAYLWQYSHPNGSVVFDCRCRRRGSS